MKILDIGSGEGGTSLYFSKSNRVVSYDLSIFRLIGQITNSSDISLINGKAEELPFRNFSFDLIILQDVIEHVINRDLLVKELKRVLKSNGIIYLSTPNKYSLLNIISDPHWGIPLLSLFNRTGIRKYFLRFFRKQDLGRKDIAQLLSLKEIRKLFKEYKVVLNTKEVVDILAKDYKGIIWSTFHIKLYSFFKKSGIILIMKKFVNNKYGLINKYLTPTFYLIIKENPVTR